MPESHDMEAENSSEKNLQCKRIVELPLILTENLLCARYSAKQFICSFIESSQLSKRHQYLLDAIRQRKHFGMACISVVTLNALRWVPRVMLM